MVSLWGYLYAASAKYYCFLWICMQTLTSSLWFKTGASLGMIIFVNLFSLLVIHRAWLITRCLGASLHWVLCFSFSMLMTWSLSGVICRSYFSKAGFGLSTLFAWHWDCLLLLWLSSVSTEVHYWSSWSCHLEWSYCFCILFCFYTYETSSQIQMRWWYSITTIYVVQGAGVFSHISFCYSPGYFLGCTCPRSVC